MPPYCKISGNFVDTLYVPHLTMFDAAIGAVITLTVKISLLLSFCKLWTMNLAVLAMTSALFSCEECRQILAEADNYTLKNIWLHLKNILVNLRNDSEYDMQSRTSARKNWLKTDKNAAIYDHKN